MAIYAVLTGDIVKSRHIQPRDELLETIKESLQEIKYKFQADYDLYRGDSFQIIVPSPSISVLIAIIIRSKLISKSKNKKEVWDARISIGIGAVDYFSNNVKESDGPAFLLSGQGLDELKKKSNRLVIKAPWQQADRMLSLVTRFADDIISNWSRYSAETAYYSLVYDEPQNALAHRLGRSQPTINKRIATAKLDLIEAYIQYVKEYVRWELRA